MVLTKFEINEKGNEEQEFFKVVGRKGGLISFLLTVMGLDNTTHFTLKKYEVLYKTSSLSGETYKFFPINNIASTHCGYSKPIQYLIWALVIFILGIYLAGNTLNGGVIFWIGLVIALGLCVLYFLKKNFTLGVESSGGETAKITFKRSIIEGVTVDIDKTKEAISLINSMLVTDQKRSDL